MLRESGGGWSSPPQPAGRNPMSPDIENREQIARISVKDMNVDDDELSPHLRDVTATPEQCYGPVPPDAEDPGVYQDAFARDVSPVPTGGIRR